MIINRSRGSGPSKATPSTLCQKCLQRGHFSYECKVTVQGRPYRSRPSRTQQLKNPDLAPKLTNDAPDNLTHKDGIADGILAAKEQEHSNRKRARSDSSSLPSAADSVSTISTSRNRSRTPPRYARTIHENDEVMLTSQLPVSPPLHRAGNDDHYSRSHQPTPLSRKRARSLSSDSHSSAESIRTEDSYEIRRRQRRIENERNTRRRRGSLSPDGQRGRQEKQERRNHKGRRDSREDSLNRSQIAKTRQRDQDDDRIQKYERLRRQSTRSDAHARNGHEPDHNYDGGIARGRGPEKRSSPGPHTERRQGRSLSPYSKRLALTQAMNVGR